MTLDKNLKILFVATEVAPFAKTGGLADVAGSLPIVLSALGHDVRIVMPRYKAINWQDTVTDFPVDIWGQKRTCIVRKGSIEAKFGADTIEVPVCFLDNYHYFDRDGIYGFWDEAERFAFFAKAVLEMLPKTEWQPDIIHCNDWQSGLIPLLLKERYKQNSFYKNMASVLTIHNLLYQGNFGKEVLNYAGLSEEYFHPDKIEFFGQVSYIKAGILYADVINTVSNSYAEEIQTPLYGEGFEGLLRKRSEDLYGIVNGISYYDFDPETDTHIYRNYNSSSIQNKKENKFALQKEMNLPVEDVPLIGFVHRLVDQKGIDLIDEIMDSIMQERLQLVVLGTGEPGYEELFRQYARKYPDKISVYIGFNNVLAQKIYAGSDLFLMPSKFEPCGLGQLIALRYGSVPIVRATGGLADTILDFDPHRLVGNGLSFEEYSSESLLETIKRGVDLFFNEPEKFVRLVISGMEQDFSWKRSATEYLKLYIKAISKAQG